jgi:hypothetical protein
VGILEYETGLLASPQSQIQTINSLLQEHVVVEDPYAEFMPGITMVEATQEFARTMPGIISELERQERDPEYLNNLRQSRHVKELEIRKRQRVLIAAILRMQRAINRNKRENVSPIRTVQYCADILEKIDKLEGNDPVNYIVRRLFENYLNPRVQIGQGGDWGSPLLNFRAEYIMS